MSCQNCGGTNSNTCNCCNPCSACPPNTADCETLPSALDNFTQHFFGTVTKTEVDGKVVWILPCNLDIGLPSNPRQDGEGLACYFLRLFLEGITGLIGPQGEKGSPGDNGRNAYTICTSAFVTPSEADPISEFTVIPSPVISVGQMIFIPGCGWVRITDILNGDTVFTTLVELIPSPSATIPAGTLVLPVGAQGRSIKGDKGDKGDKGEIGPQGVQGATGNVGPTGDPGPAGTDVTHTNGEVVITGGTNYEITDVMSKVNFGANDPEVTFPEAGTYLLVATIVGYNDSGVGEQWWTFQFFNATTATVYSESILLTSIHVDTSITRPGSVTLTSIVTTSAVNQLVELQAQSESNSGTQALLSDFTKLTYVRLG